MATSKKSTTKKTVTAPVEKELTFATTPAEAEAQLTAAPVSTTNTESAVPAEKYYRFMTMVNNLNINNVIFNATNVIVFETAARSVNEAVIIYKKKVLSNFQGDMDKAIFYIKAVFGGTDGLIVEEYAAKSITRHVVSV